MNIQIEASLSHKLAILADAAKYDASCASSGASGRNSRDGKGLGSTTGSGICHAYTPDGRCVSLLKVLLTNFCVYDSAFCVNRLSSNTPRARFKVEEVVALTLGFYRRNMIEGLFLSSGIAKSEDHTMEEMVRVAETLRRDHDFRGYIHLKAIAGASQDLIERAGRPADRLSVNVELPADEALARLAPQKDALVIRKAMGGLRLRLDETKEEKRRTPRAPRFAPAGQSTQMIIGAGLSAAECYLTNAVKHFKFTPRGKRRIHKTPGAREIDHCRWWLDRELALVESPLVVTLGASALRAVAGPSARLADMRGRPIALGARTLLPTIHPAYLLRLPDPAAKEAETSVFANDLKQAAFLAEGGWQENDN